MCFVKQHSESYLFCHQTSVQPVLENSYNFDYMRHAGSNLSVGSCRAVLICTMLYRQSTVVSISGNLGCTTIQILTIQILKIQFLIILSAFALSFCFFFKFSFNIIIFINFFRMTRFYFIQFLIIFWDMDKINFQTYLNTAIFKNYALFYFFKFFSISNYILRYDPLKISKRIWIVGIWIVIYSLGIKLHYIPDVIIHVGIMDQLSSPQKYVFNLIFQPQQSYSYFVDNNKKYSFNNVFRYKKHTLNKIRAHKFSILVWNFTILTDLAWLLPSFRVLSLTRGNLEEFFL